MSQDDIKIPKPQPIDTSPIDSELPDMTIPGPVGNPNEQLPVVVGQAEKLQKKALANVDDLFEKHSLQEGKYYIRMLTSGDYEAVTDEGNIIALSQKRASDLITSMNADPEYVNLELKNGTRVTVKKDGRVNHFTLKNIEFNTLISSTILENLIEGLSLKEICEIDGMPTRATILRWTHEYPAFGKEYKIARKLSVDIIEDNILEVANDDKNTYDKEYLNASKLKVSALEKMAKVKSIGYSEKVKEQESGNHFYFDKSLIGLGSGIAPKDRVLDVEGKTMTNDKFMSTFSADDTSPDDEAETKIIGIVPAEETK